MARAETETLPAIPPRSAVRDASATLVLLRRERVHDDDPRVTQRLAHGRLVDEEPRARPGGEAGRRGAAHLGRQRPAFGRPAFRSRHPARPRHRSRWPAGSTRAARRRCCDRGGREPRTCRARPRDRPNASATSAGAGIVKRSPLAGWDSSATTSRKTAPGRCPASWSGRALSTRKSMPAGQRSVDDTALDQPELRRVESRRELGGRDERPRPGHRHPPLSGRKKARTSSTRASGCSSAADRPPRGSGSSPHVGARSASERGGGVISRGKARCPVGASIRRWATGSGGQPIVVGPERGVDRPGHRVVITSVRMSSHPTLRLDLAAAVRPALELLDDPGC